MQIIIDNINMTDRQIEQMAIRVADIVIQALEEKQQQWDKALVAVSYTHLTLPTNREV